MGAVRSAGNVAVRALVVVIAVILIVILLITSVLVVVAASGGYLAIRLLGRREMADNFFYSLWSYTLFGFSTEE